MHITSVLNKDQNHYYCNICLEIGSHQLPYNKDKSTFLHKLKMLYYDKFRFLNELMLIKQVHQKCMIFFTIVLFR